MRIMEHAKGIGLNGKGERTMIGNMRNTVPLALVLLLALAGGAAAGATSGAVAGGTAGLVTNPF